MPDKTAGKTGRPPTHSSPSTRSLEHWKIQEVLEVLWGKSQTRGFPSPQEESPSLFPERVKSTRTLVSAPDRALDSSPPKSHTKATRHRGRSGVASSMRARCVYTVCVCTCCTCACVYAMHTHVHVCFLEQGFAICPKWAY